MLEKKSTTKQKLKDFYPHVVSFHPMAMNMMYLGPTHRRDFLDEALSQSFSSYKACLAKYKKIVTSRNRLLKNIAEGKSSISELDFWNRSFIDSAVEIYNFRKKICDYLKSRIGELSLYFFGKVETVDFSYITKVDMNAIELSLTEYVKNNSQKEILLKKTLRGPHLDDFNIFIDGLPLIHFASRGEVKSIILGLKFLESSFIEHHSNKSEILFLIDDLLSELDEKHRNELWKHIGDRQSIITSIEDFSISGNKIFI